MSAAGTRVLETHSRVPGAGFARPRPAACPPRSGCIAHVTLAELSASRALGAARAPSGWALGSRGSREWFAKGVGDSLRLPLHFCPRETLLCSDSRHPSWGLSQ